jgi:Zn-finger nucleic acid-binding protein
MMRQSLGEELALMRCGGCGGMLLETGVLERIRDAVRADEFFDTGHPKVGRALDEMDPFDCPACGQPMRSTPHPDQRHVRIERCDGCGALFLDAGELIDLSRDSLLERIWETLTGRLGRR